MKSPTASSSHAKDERLKIHREEEEQDVEQEELAQQKQEIVDEVHSFIHETLGEMRVASTQESQRLIEGLDHLELDQKEIDGWKMYVRGTMRRQLQSASILVSERERWALRLKEARQDKVISQRVYERKMDELFSTNIDYKDREEYIYMTLPKRMEAWQKVKDLRDKLVRHKHIDTIRSTSIPNIEKLFDAEDFVNLGWEERKELVERVDAQLSARQNNIESLMPGVQAELEGFRDEGILHRTKVSTWMQRIFTRNNTEKGVKDYMKKDMMKTAHAWRTVRAKFDGINRKFADEGIPQGWNVATTNEFLLWHYNQRTSYCTQADIRLRNVEETDKRMATIKLHIRHNLDSRDWIGAERDINLALNIRSDDPELLSMKDFLVCHRNDEPEANKEHEQTSRSPEELHDIIRSTLSQIPSPLHSLYARAAEKGPHVLNRLLQVISNRKWLYDVARVTPEREAEMIATVRASEDPGQSTILDMGSMGSDEILSQIEAHGDDLAGSDAPALNGNEQWGFYATLIPPIPLDTYRSIIQHQHYPLKKALRELHEQGIPFRMTGTTRKAA
jgi:hypothetical protein